MTINAYSFVGIYDHLLRASAHVLDKAREHAASQGIAERDMLEWRLIDDMQPLSFQLGVICNWPSQWLARVAGLPLPEPFTEATDLAAYQRGIARARAYLAELKPEQFEGRDAADVAYTIMPGMTVTQPAESWLTIFASTNIFFHVTTAYDILRSRGVPLGKADLFAGWL